MPYPVVLVTEFGTTLSGDTLLKAIPDAQIENRPFPRRFYNFNMVITQPFSFQNMTRLVLTDNNGVDNYLLIDRLNKPVIAQELECYASNRRCIPSQYDSVTKTIKILACITPTCKYINEWLAPSTSKDPVDPTLPPATPEA